MAKIRGDSLQGVSATTLWTLHSRAAEARRSNSVIDDPMAIHLHDSIDYEYAKFGRPSQTVPIRSSAFDNQTRRYLSERPKAAVVALAEGLQTSFWRLDNGELTWYSIDFPAVIDLRSELLPRDRRIVQIAQSALDLSWMDRVDTSNGVFLTAEGLLMYLQPEESLGLIAACAQRFPGGQMLFDSIPHWYSRRSMNGMSITPSYTAPPMPFALSPDEAMALHSVPGVVAVQDIPLPTGRGILPLIGKALTNKAVDRGFLRRTRPTFTLLQFG